MNSVAHLSARAPYHRGDRPDTPQFEFSNYVKSTVRDLQKTKRTEDEKRAIEEKLIADVVACGDASLRLEPDPLHYFLSYFLSRRDSLSQEQVDGITQTLEAKIPSTHVPKYNTIAIKLFYSLCDLDLPWSYKGREKVRQFILNVSSHTTAQNGINPGQLQQYLSKISELLGKDEFPFTPAEKQMFLDWVMHTASAACSAPLATRDTYEPGHRAPHVKVERPGMYAPRGTSSSDLPPLEYAAQDPRKRRRVDMPAQVQPPTYSTSAWPAATASPPIYDFSAAGNWVPRTQEQMTQPPVWSTVKEETYAYHHVRSSQSYNAPVRESIEVEPGEYVPAITAPQTWNIDACRSRILWCGQSADHPLARPMLESVYDRMKDLNETQQGDYLAVRDAFLKLGAVQLAARAEKRGPRQPRQPAAHYPQY